MPQLSCYLFATVPLFAEAGQGRSGNLTQTLFMIAVAIIFFYFILWRPERKRRKAVEDMRTAMKKGDRVTAMGIVGTVDKIQEKTVILKMVDGSKIEVVKMAITELHPVSDKPEETPPNP